MKGESWVTSAGNDLEAWEALVLLRSLKRTYTTKSFTIIINNGVSDELRYLLQHEYDLVSTVNCQESQKLFIWAWTLNCWRKCVYLRPNSLALQFLDDVFKYECFGRGKIGKFTGLLKLAFIFHPSFKIFKQLKAIYDGSVIKNGEVSKSIEAKFDTSSALLPELIFNHDTSYEDTSDVNPKLIHFEQSVWFENRKRDSEFRYKNMFVKLWTEIFVHDIVPYINNEEDSNLQSYFRKSIIKYGLPLKNGINPPSKLTNFENMEDSIAIVGLSCRFPGANNADEFWELLKNGIDPMIKFPSNRPHPCSTSSDNLDKFEAGFLKCPVDEFDAKFFGISPREAPFVDPQQRILLEVIWESLENSLINPQELKDSNTGVFLGIWQQDYAHLLPTNIGLNTNDLHHRYLGNAFSATASRISHFIGMFGPNYSIESGCSSSSVAIHLACESLKRGETDLTIACGVNLVLFPINPFSEGDEEESIILSSDYRCKTFDESANGFARAEGCAAIILKRYVDAVREGDQIHAIIRGTSLNNDGPGTSFGTPNALAQQRVFRDALSNARVHADEVSYIEAHGTGTAVGDPTEMHAISQVYSSNRTSENVLMISSVKSNIGHAEACAGLAGLIKTILCFKYKSIPPHLHLKTLNHRINLELIPAKIPTQLTPWNVNDNQRRIAGVSSFSMSGTNVHIILQEPDPEAKLLGNGEAFNKTNPNKKCPYELIQISAKCEQALEEQRNNYVQFLTKIKNSDAHIQIKDLAYATNVGRASFNNRIAIVGKSENDVLEKLQNRAYLKGKVTSNVEPNVCFLFSGQGSQYFGMGKQLYQAFPTFKSAFDKCSRKFESLEGITLEEIIWEDPAHLAQSIYCQPAIFCIQHSLVQLWKSFGILPSIVLGHSVGEFCAAVTSGVLTFDEALVLLIERSKLVQSLEPGTMLAIKTSYVTVKKAIEEFEKNNNRDCWIDVAAINSEEETVISGTLRNVKMFEKVCISKGLKTQEILSSHAFHSRQMNGVLEEFAKKAKATCHPKNPQVQYISGTYGKYLENAEEFYSEYWKNHLRESVQFSEAIQIAMKESQIMIEIGSKPILLSLAMCNNLVCGNVQAFCPSLRTNEEETLTIMTSLSKLWINGFDIKWKSSWFGPSYHKPTSFSLPTYPFIRKKYWYETDDEFSMETSSLNPNKNYIHPFLGNIIPVPISDKVFSSILQFGKAKPDKSIQFLQDHKIVDRLIFPAAGFLDMIMYSGKWILTCGAVNMVVPFTIEDFNVGAALELSNKPTHIETIVKSSTKEDGLMYEISIHRKLGSPDNWKRHAVGTFNPSTKIQPPQNIDISMLLNTLKLQESSKIESVYNKINELGIQFGPKFQSIESVWMNTNNGDILIKIHQISEPLEKFVCHPIILDAMIQASAFKTILNLSDSELKGFKQMLLPLSVKKFTWLSKPVKIGDSIYAYLKENRVELYDGSGEVLGIMEGLELLKVSKDSFIRTLNAENEMLPAFLEEVWKPVFSVTRSRINSNLLQVPTKDSEYVYKSLEASRAEESLDEADDTNRAFLLFLIRGIQELKWTWPKLLGSIICPSDWKQKGSKHLQNIKTYEYFMELLAWEGYLERMSSDKETKEENEVYKYKVLKPLPSLKECQKELDEFYSKDENSRADKVSFQFAKRCGQHFTNLLDGGITPLDYMFPSDPNEVASVRFFNDSKLYKHLSNLMIAMVLDTISHLSRSQSNSGILRILEVGAGTGRSSAQLMDELNKIGIAYHYTFTDISPLFISEAQNTALKDYKNVACSILNIEEDPLVQGFPANQYDVILAGQVIHATANVKEALGHINNLLRDRGILVLSEQFKTEYFISLSFGFLDGWWRFNDFRLFTPLLSCDSWVRVFEETGFQNTLPLAGLGNRCGGVIGQKIFDAKVVDLLPVNPNPKHSWIIFSDESNLANSLAQKLRCSNRSVFVVYNNTHADEQSTSQDTTLIFQDSKVYINYKSKEAIENLFESLGSISVEGVVYMWTKFSSNPEVPEVILENYCIGLLYLCQVLITKSHELIKKKCFPPRFYVLTRGLYYIGDTSPGNPTSATSWGLIRSFINENPEYRVNLIDLDQNQESPNNLRFETEEIFAQFWNIKEREYFIALKEEKKYVSRLVPQNKRILPLVMPNSDRYKIQNPANGNFEDLIALSSSCDVVDEDKVEIAVKATALNFRDLFMVLKPEGFDIPVGKLEIGFDIAGIITKTGPNVSKFKPGDHVFGFTNTGGFGSHVVVTEKVLLRKPMNMTFSSAATIPCAFLTVVYSLIHCARIQRNEKVLIHVATGGVGLAAIQIAKNYGATIFATAGSKRKRNYLRHSLGIKYVYHSRNTDFGEEILRDTNGEGVDIVLNSLTGPGFKEASLKSCANCARFVEIGKMNIWTENEVQNLRSDVKYFVVDLAEKSQENPQELESYLTNVEKEFESGIYTGLPHVSYPFELIREAFHYFQKAKHIGKIVIKMPKFEISQEGKFGFRNYLFNPESTYLITGGLGGIGMEVALWMATSGAQNIILLGRGLPTSTSEERLKSKNVNYLVLQADIGDFMQCKRLLNMISTQLHFPPLRGIMHAAGVISDSLIINQNWDKYKATFQPKINGAWNLHELTYNYDLEFFSMFSSGVGIIGTPGQSNHAAANLFLDSLVHYRISLGLPGNTMDFGAWSDVGAAAHIQLGQEGGLGFRSFTPKQGLKSIEKALKEHHEQSIIVSVPDWTTVKQFIRIGNYLDELKSNETSPNKEFTEKHKKMIEEINLAPPSEKQTKLQYYMEVVLKETLRIPENESLDHDQDFSEMGVDSLMGMEMRNRLQGLLPAERTLTVSAVQENRTIRKLSGHIAHLINSENTTEEEVNKLPISEIIKQDCVLPEDIVRLLKAASYSHRFKPSEFRSVLLTGATGHLGSHLLPELCSQDSIQKIYVLIRGSTFEEAETRLHKVIKKYGFVNIDMTKIKVLQGDVRDTKLGLGQTSYETLVEEIDGIIHCAIKCNHVEGYMDEGENSMRAHNVFGIQNILRFAVTGKMKPILHTSALTAVTRMSHDGIPSEDFPEDPSDGIEIKSGYILSKFISEYILGQAAQTYHVPIVIVRLSAIFGNSQTGHIPPGYNHAWNILLSCIRVRKFPSIDQHGFPVMAVDNVAKIAKELFFNDSLEYGVYNLTYDTVLEQEELVEVFHKFGIEAEFIPPLEWRDLVMDEYGATELGPVAYLYENETEHFSPRGLTFHPLARNCMNVDENSESSNNSEPHHIMVQLDRLTDKVKRNIPNIENFVVCPKLVLERHLDYYYQNLSQSQNQPNPKRTETHA